MILLSLIEQAQNRTALATKWLEKAVTLAEPEGFLRLFLEEGLPIARLLPNVRHIAPRFVDDLLKAFSKTSGSVNEAFTLPANSQLLAALSEQELRVLRLVVAGKSNQEVAETLVISLGTAKWHVHNILQKLGVSNRPQAIARARELGLA
jgi:LuxR family maltose regulon positive regulatory protein